MPQPRDITDMLGPGVARVAAPANPTPEAPKSAHLTLALAAERLLNLTIPEAADDCLGQLELATKNYRAAEAQAREINFGSLAATALRCLDTGNLDGVRTCLNVLNMASDYVPLVDLESVTAPKAADGV